MIISAKAIPGNEASVSAVLDYLLKAGAKVAYQEFSEIHVSGHASIEEQKLMLTLTKPKFFPRFMENTITSPNTKKQR